jgi:hypothetical protein
VAENTRRIEEAQQVALEAKEGKAVNEEGKATQYDVARAQSDPKNRKRSWPWWRRGLIFASSPTVTTSTPSPFFLDGLFFF